MEPKAKRTARTNWEKRRHFIARARERADEVEALWRAVSRNRELLGRGDNFPVMHSLHESWRVLDEHYGGIVKRADVERTATTPFEAAMFHIEMGFYPPPELLLTLLDAYETYLQGRGRPTLEEVFFGRPKRKAGVHAQRRANRSKLVYMSIRMHFLIKDGKTKIRAAEIISEELGGKPEPESIIRLLNASRLNRIIKGV